MTLRWLLAVIAAFTNLKSFQIMSDVLWPVPPSILLPSYKIYYINFTCSYHPRRVVVVVVCVEEKNKQSFSHDIGPFLLGKYDALCMLTSLTLYCILMKWHATRNVLYIYVRQFKFIGFIKVVVWWQTMYRNGFTLMVFVEFWHELRHLLFLIN